MNKFKLGEFVSAFGYVAEILDIRVEYKVKFGDPVVQGDWVYEHSITKLSKEDQIKEIENQQELLKQKLDQLAMEYTKSYQALNETLEYLYKK